MRRLYLRGRENIGKRLLIHAAGFNLGLLMRHHCGIGKPRRLQSPVKNGACTVFVLSGAFYRSRERLWGILVAFQHRYHLPPSRNVPQLSRRNTLTARRPR